MILDRVTLTGADDWTDIEQMIVLSREFPFVEWGVLFSRRADGIPRYPSRRWIDGMLDMTSAEPSFKLSAHLCGGYMRDTLDGYATWWREFGALTAHFQRVQLNCSAERPDRALGGFVREIARMPEHRFIFQCSERNHAMVWALTKCRVGDVLFDQSGGRGEVPIQWPDVWPETYCGYAGGLGPETLYDEMPRINAAAPGHVRVWIDMESGIRTDSLFDLGKARRVLETLEPLIPGMSDANPAGKSRTLP